MGLVAWRRPQALRPASLRAAVTAPAAAAAGWLQEALVPAGEPLAEGAARSLVVQWQETKALALGARSLSHYHDLAQQSNVICHQQVAW